MNESSYELMGGVLRALQREVPGVEDNVIHLHREKIVILLRFAVVSLQGCNNLALGRSRVANEAKLHTGT